MLKIINYFDQATSTLTYLLYEDETKDAVIIDPVLDFDQAALTLKENSIKSLLQDIKSLELKIHYILETHAHADHLSSAQLLKTKYFKKAKIGIGSQIKSVQKTFAPLFNFPESFAKDGSQFDTLFEDGCEVTAGKLTFKVLHTPGHTPACATYLFKNAAFTGDALFLPDSGTGRCDFPGGNALALFSSIQKIYALPEETKIYVGHDYQPGGRELAFSTTVKDSKENNIHLKGTTSQDEFVSFREKRDATLQAPRLLYPSIQVNIAAGKLPPPEANGRSYLKLPVVPIA